MHYLMFPNNLRIFSNFRQNGFCRFRNPLLFFFVVVNHGLSIPQVGFLFYACPVVNPQRRLQRIRGHRTKAFLMTEGSIPRSLGAPRLQVVQIFRFLELSAESGSRPHPPRNLQFVFCTHPVGVHLELGLVARLGGWSCMGPRWLVGA